MAYLFVILSETSFRKEDSSFCRIRCAPAKVLHLSDINLYRLPPRPTNRANVALNASVLSRNILQDEWLLPGNIRIHIDMLWSGMLGGEEGF